MVKVFRTLRKEDDLKHHKNCECCPRHSLFKGHKVIVESTINNVDIVVLNCQQCNQCLKCQVTRFSKNLKIFKTECDIRENFDTNECLNIFVSTKLHE